VESKPIELTEAEKRNVVASGSGFEEVGPVGPSDKVSVIQDK
jgi:hypothetical protein